MLRSRIGRATSAATLLVLWLVPSALARHEPHVVRTPTEVLGDRLGALEEQPFTLTLPAVGELTSTFGPRWGRMHHGIDIGTLTKLGVVAAADGRVTHTGYLPRFAGYGRVILVDHGEGRMTLYAHLSRIRVAPGDEVAAGYWIGNAGCTGVCIGTHLHFELRHDGVPVDPLPYFEASP